MFSPPSSDCLYVSVSDTSGQSLECGAALSHHLPWPQVPAQSVSRSPPPADPTALQVSPRGYFNFFKHPENPFDILDMN